MNPDTATDTPSLDFDITAWWGMRMFAWAIPGFLCLLGWYRLDPEDFESIATLAVGALAIFIVLQYSVNFSIQTRGRRLRYWKLPKLISRPMEILADDIERYEFIVGDRPSLSVLVHLRDKAPVVMHLASFRLEDASRVIAWLDHHLRGDEDR